MKTGTKRKYYVVLLAVVIAFWACMLLGGYDSALVQVDNALLSSDMMETPAMLPGDTLTQEIDVSRRFLTGVTVHLVKGQRVAVSYTLEGEGKLLAEGSIDQEIAEERIITLIDDEIDISGYKSVNLILSALEDNDATFFYGSMVQLPRGLAPIPGLSPSNSLRYNEQVLPGKLNIETVQVTPYQVSTTIWLLFVVSVLLLGLTYFVNMKRIDKDKNNAFLRISNAFERYQFMLQQLVTRNFKTKYKRSILGVLWSFLNPLLTMLIQYVVFSTIFKSSIEYFPVYLLTGTVCFAFFSEATSTGLSSISGNASLITKVYIPKYIFPISTTLSSGINFALTLIPLFATTLLSGLPITRAFFFLPMLFLCLLMFCLGMAMLLSTVMVFFRDIQFLWGVITTLLVYATPLFYPESIMPERFTFIFKVNPLYHIIRIFRVILINGVPPEPRAVLVCAVYCFAVLLFGASVFKLYQDRFVLNL